MKRDIIRAKINKTENLYTKGKKKSKAKSEFLENPNKPWQDWSKKKEGKCNF